jgi:hypothetical protein
MLSVDREAGEAGDGTGLACEERGADAGRGRHHSRHREVRGMTRTSRLSRAIPLLALFACAVASCHQISPDLAPVDLDAATTPVARASRPLSTPEREDALPANPPSALAGGRVVWTAFAPLRAAPAGVGTFLADVEAHLPPDLGLRYRDRDRVTWCHETTHGVHSALRNRYRLAAFYPGGGRCALVEPPAVTLGDVAAVVPPQWRGTRYNLYLVSQRRDWDRDPLYVWDEWVAYDNGTTAGIEAGLRPSAGASDDAVSCIELSGYALAVAAAARRKGAPVSEQFREFLAWELRRSLALYAYAIKLPAFAWHDRRLEQRWRAGDPFVTEELRALYGESLTVQDLLR